MSTLSEMAIEDLQDDLAEARAYIRHLNNELDALASLRAQALAEIDRLRLELVKYELMMRTYKLSELVDEHGQWKDAP